MKIATAFLFLSSSAFAQENPQAAIDYLWSLPNPAQEENIAPENSPLQEQLDGHTPRFPFLFTVINSIPTVGGFDFKVNFIRCSTLLLNPFGSSAGTEDATVNLNPPALKGQSGSWEQKKRGCVVAYACNYELGIKDLESDPASRRIFGPFVGSNATQCIGQVTIKPTSIE